MLTAIGIIGIISLALGVMHFLFPKSIKALDSFLGQVVADVCALTEKRRVAFGIFYIIVGIFMLYVSFFR